MKTIVRLVQTTNKSDHMIVCMDDISTCVGCRITPTGSPNLDCIDNNQSSRQTIHHLRVLLLCARAVPAVRVCTCPVHACAHYSVRRCPSPGRPSSGAGGRGSATPASRGRPVRVWGPSTGPTARDLAGWRCAPWGWRKGVPGGAAVRRCEGRTRSGAPPPPAARPLRGLPGPTTTHWLWARGAAGVGTHLQPHSARFCELALRAVGAARGRPGGTPPALVWGVRRRALPLPWLPGALPSLTARPLCGLPGPTTTHWLWARGGAGVGTHLQPHSARSCELALRAVGAARVRPGVAPPAWVWGVRGRALSQPRLPALWAGSRGPPPTGCGCGGMRAWGPVTNSTARALARCAA